MILDETDIKYLLRKNGYSYKKVAEQLDVSFQIVYEVSRGIKTSRRIRTHIEQLLGIKEGTLRISKERCPPLIKVA
ncbi:MAG: hypothetical protein AVO39_10115 [delta proteobacterium MLS_D]|jgi:ribosome-binding protein aMBF1 (putative translation factor)|nr:MAG: hypothetical protein AVO39_10115 [delta proteobacterium MLS_D]